MRTTETIAIKLAWPIAGTSLLLIAAGILLGALAMAGAGSPVGLLSHQLTIPVSGAVFAVMGGLILSRHPRHPIARLLAGLGIITGVEVLNLGYLAHSSLNAPGEVIPGPEISHWLANWIYSPRVLIPMTLLLLLFPDGRLPSRRWLPVAWVAVLGIVASTVTSALTPISWEGLGGIVRNPFGVQSPLLVSATSLSGVLGLSALLACAASVFVRFRQAKGIERQQLKWLTYTLGVVLLSFVGVGVLFALLPNSRLATELAFSAVNIATIAIAISVSVAVLRYRLYDIDLILNRTLVYGALTALVIGLYVLVVGSMSAIFQTKGSLLIALVATGLIAMLFQPMRERLQRAVNRLLYGQRDEPYSVISQMGRRLEGAEAPEAMYETIVETVAQSLKLPYVAIALVDSGGLRVAAEIGQATGTRVNFPLSYQGEWVGELICAPRSPGEPFSDSEVDLLQDISNQVAVAVHALMLGAALQRSREQLISAREEERRRLRRDLHDGLGPQLASLALKIDAARNQLKDDPKISDAILLQMRWDAQDAIADIRRLVHNLRPPVLDELGLLSALRASAASQLSSPGPHVVVEGPESLPALPAAVEVAAYRIAQEAVNNVVRHAHAQHCYVRLGLNGGLRLEVQDDGSGLPDQLRAGVGLNSMRERAQELGGSFRIEALPEGGTRVLAQFPLSQ